MSRGAVQGNFKDKDEIFLAVAASRWSPVIPPFTPGESLAERMRSFADALIAALPERRAAAIGFTSFQTYALTHDELRREVVQTIAEIYRKAAENLVSAIPEADLPMPAEIFVRVVHALTEGLTYQAFMTPELMRDDVIHAAFAALARDGG